MLPLERLATGGHHHQPIERQRVHGVLRHEEVPHVRGVEAPAEDPEAPGGVGHATAAGLAGAQDQPRGAAPGPGRARVCRGTASAEAGPATVSRGGGGTTAVSALAASVGAAPQCAATSASPG